MLDFLYDLGCTFTLFVLVVFMEGVIATRKKCKMDRSYPVCGAADHLCFCGGIYARFGRVPVFAHSCGLVSGGVFFLQTSGEKRQNYAYHQGTNERLMRRKKGSLSAPFFVGKIL